MNRKLTPAVPLLAIAFAACADEYPVGPEIASPRPTATALGTTPPPSGSRREEHTDDTDASGGTGGGPTADTLATGATGGAPAGPTAGPTSSPAGGPSTGPTAGNDRGVATRVAATGGFTIVVPGTEVIVGYRETPYPAAAGGWCGNGENGAPWGTWTKTTKGTTSVHVLHVHCTIRETTPEQRITVAFADSATYVQSPSGNLALNFDDGCATAAATVTAAQCSERFIHYRANQDRTEGRGVLTGQGSDGSVWTLDLAQIAHALNARAVPGDGIAPDLRRYVMLSAFSATGDRNDSAVIRW